MAGLFDDLTSGADTGGGSGSVGSGMFDDLRPVQKTSGILGTLNQGIKSTARSVGATADTYTGDSQGVVDASRAQREAPKDERLQGFYDDIESRRVEGDGLGAALKNVGGAVVDNPAGAGLAVVEQAPNAVPTLAGGWAGAKAGFALTPPVLPVAGPLAKPIGAVVGGLAGMFVGNTAIETGHKAMEMADDGDFTPEESSQAKREGAIKGGVITGVDAITLGFSRLVSTGLGRPITAAMESATRRTLVNSGVDVADDAAVAAALRNPDIVTAVRGAQETAIKTTDNFRRRAGEGIGILGMESVGEGVGEYLGELAATGEADITDAVLESLLSLGQSGVETAWNMRGSRHARQVMPMPTDENPNPSPVDAPDPAGGILSRAASQLPEATPEPILDIARLNAAGLPEPAAYGLTPYERNQLRDRGMTDDQISSITTVEGRRLLAEDPGQAQSEPLLLTDQRQSGMTVDAEGNAVPAMLPSSAPDSPQGGRGMDGVIPMGEQPNVGTAEDIRQMNRAEQRRYEQERADRAAQVFMDGVNREAVAAVERGEPESQYTIPPGLELADPEGHGRWHAQLYRNSVEGLTGQLTVGGDVAYVRDEHDRITHRTPSINPSWWQDMDTSVKPKSVNEAKRIVQKALDGEKLGPKQARFIAAMMDMTDDMSVDPAQERQGQIDQIQIDRGLVNAAMGNAADFGVERSREVSEQDDAELYAYLDGRVEPFRLSDLTPADNEVINSEFILLDDTTEATRQAGDINDGDLNGNYERAGQAGGQVSAQQGIQDGGRGEAESGGAVPADGFALEAQTETELAQQEEARQATEQAEVEAQRRADADEQAEVEAQRRADADEQVDGFALTGSDRTADVAAAAGQEDLLGAQSAAEKESAPSGEGVRIVRQSGSVEMVPQAAVDHRQAIIDNDDIDVTDSLSERLAGMGWTDMQISANALNMTEERFREQVESGLYSELYGVSTREVLRRNARPAIEAEPATQQQTSPEAQTESAAPSIEGEDLGDGWAAFSPESGTLGIPRAEMPQIKAEHRGAMVNFLAGRGVMRRKKTVPASSLKPTQAEFSRDKVVKAKAYEGGERSILVSRDGHVLDGHHQWMAKRDAGEDVEVIELNRNMSNLLEIVREFPSATQDDASGPQAEASTGAEAPAVIEDVGEKLGGARKDEFRNIRERLDGMSDDEIAGSTLSKMWPKSEVDRIEDPFQAAAHHVIRGLIPAKPRAPYRIKAWVDKVKAARDLSGTFADFGGDLSLEAMRSHGGLGPVVSQVELYMGIDRKHWGRVGDASIRHGRYNQDGEMVPGSWVSLKIDGRGKTLYGHDSIASALPRINELLGDAAPEQKMKFSIYYNRSSGEAYIVRDGDREKRHLKTFPDTTEARKFLDGNYDALAEAWEAVKNRDNVTRADMRRASNEERAGRDYRDGKDVTPEQFLEHFGFRGVEFGNWVKQGKGGRERQGILNDAYDAFMDMAGVLDVPPKAISLNGSLGIGFGSRGRGGRAAAHFEPANIVINLTKTQGAGSLAHEWFHALDNYFSRQRSGEVPMTRGLNAQQAYRTNNYITYRPEPMLRSKLRPGAVMARERVEQLRKNQPNDEMFKASNWESDPNHPQGVRPEVERAFAELVLTLNASPMAERSRTIDGSSVDGYWSQIIERGARSFETYMIARLADQGARNDYLANVQSLEDFARNAERYPYLTPDEQGPVNEAFDKLFSTIETREAEGGNVAMFRRSASSATSTTLSRGDVEKIAVRLVTKAAVTRDFVFSSWEQLPQAIKDAAAAQGARPGDVKAVHWRGKSYFVDRRFADARDVERTIFHEHFAHYGLRQKYGKDLEGRMNGLLMQLGGVRGLQQMAASQGFNIDHYIEGAAADASLSASQRGALIMDELLAHMAEATGTLKRTLQEWYGIVRNWLRENGYAELAKLNAADLALELRMARQAALGAGEVQIQAAATVDAFDSRLEESKGAFGDQLNEREASEVQSREPGSDGAGKGMLDLFAPAGIPARDAERQAEDNFALRYIHQEVAQLRSGFDRVTTPEELAHVVASIRKHGQETLMVVVTDSNDKILNVIRHSKGLRASTSASPSEIAQAAAATPGAANVWTAHNHPSGEVQPSDADFNVDNMVRKALDGTGIRVRGAVTIGSGRDAASYAYMDGLRHERGMRITPANRIRSIPVTERILRKRMPMDQYGRVTSPIAARGAVARVKSDSALVLLTNQHDVIGSLTLTDPEMKAIREGGVARRILAAIDSTNATAGVIKASDRDGAVNLGRFLNNGDHLRVLDWFDGDLRSGAADGDRIGDGPFFSRSARQTNSVPFKRWFGDSKVVDAEGKPLMVYHGTGSDFSEFSEAFFGDSTGVGDLGEGFYFSNSPSVASSFAEDAYGDNPSVMPVFLSIKNPATNDILMSDRVQGVLDDDMGFESLRDVLAEMGYDGIAFDHRNGNGVEYVAFSPEQIKSAIGNIGTFDPDNADIRFSRGPGLIDRAINRTAPTRTADAFNDLNQAQRSLLNKVGSPATVTRVRDWVQSQTERIGTRVRQGLVDRYAALKELDEKLLGADFIENSIRDSSWVLARMSSGAAGAMTAMMNHGRLQFNRKEKLITMRQGDETGGLTAVLARLGSPAEVERFMGWMAANRADKLMSEGRENLFTREEIDAGKNLNTGMTENGDARQALYDTAHREFQQYRDDVLAIAEAAGIISAENRAMWRDEFYVPFYRVMDEEAAGPRTGKGLSRQEAYKRLKGGKENLNDLLENTMMNFHHLLSASMKNQAATQVIQNAEAAGIARPVMESRRDTKTSTFILKDGKRAFYQVDDGLVFGALTALADPGLNNMAVQVMSGFKRVFTNMTTVTPQFIIANAMRDQMQAAATSPVSKNVLKNLVEGVGSYRDATTRAEMLASGAAFSFGHLYGADVNEVKASLQRNLRGAELITDPAMVPKVLRAAWRKWGDVADTAENTSRAAVYAQNVEQRGQLRAAFEARDVMDFSQHGGWPAIRFLIRVVPFLNARLQGLDKLYRSGAKPALLTAMGKGTASDKQAAARFGIVTGALTMASIALYLANADDDEYRKLEDWQKDAYWFFRIGSQAFFIPKPFEVGAIATMAERLTEQMVDDKATGKLFRERLGDMLMQTFSFNPTPQMFQPVLDIYANRDAFTGRQIETQGMERLSIGLRARDNTTAAARAVSAVSRVAGDESPVALSPVQADHLIRGYLGAVGANAAGMIDTIWRTASGQEAPDKHLLERQPFRRFYKNLDTPVPYTRYSTLFYDGLREANRVYADVMELQKLGRQSEALDLMAEKRNVLGMRAMLNQQQRKLSEVNKQIEQVRRSPKDGAWKRREIDRLNLIRSRLTEMAGKHVESARAT